MTTHMKTTEARPARATVPPQRTVPILGAIGMAALVRAVEIAGSCVVEGVPDACGKLRSVGVRVGHDTFVFDACLVDTSSLANVLARGDVITYAPMPALVELLQLGDNVRDAALAQRIVENMAGGVATELDLMSAPGISAEALAGAINVVPAAPSAADWSGVAGRTGRVGRAAEVINERVHGAQLDDVVELEHRVRGVVRRMSRSGVGVNRSGWMDLVRQRTERAAEIQYTVRERLGVTNLTEPEALKGVFARQGVELPDTRSPTLLRFGVPLAQEIVEWRRLNAFCSDLGPAVSRALDASTDGRVHATWEALGAWTGRMSCRSPALQAVPRDPEVRRLFVPRPGHRIIQADYHSCELRIVAQITRDPAMIALFCDGGDLHRSTAAAMLKKDPKAVTDAERKLAKPVNFGISFGMRAEGLVDHAWAEFGIQMTVEDAAAYREAFLDKYSGVATWHRQMGDEMPSELRSLLGRLIRFPSRAHGLNQRLAGPVQASAADAIKRALVLLEPEIEPLGGVIVHVVHDEILVEVSEATATAARDEVVWAMTTALAELTPDIPVVVDSSVRSSWAAEG